jgi:hypothetical protein
MGHDTDMDDSKDPSIIQGVDGDIEDQSKESGLEKPSSRQRELSATTAPSNAHLPPPPPNGGLKAWLHVLGGFCLFFNTWGILNAFGVFQTYYESGALFTETSSNIAWIGAIQSYMVLTVGFVSGPIFDRGYLRTLLVIGSFGVVFGHMMLSLCTTYWQVLLAQGFCVGIGAGCLFVPCVSVLPTYFSTRVGLVIGLAAAGSSCRYPPVLLQIFFPRSHPSTALLSFSHQSPSVLKKKKLTWLSPSPL